MNKNEQLPATIDVGPQVPATTDFSVGQMMAAVIDKGITEQNVAAFEKLIDLQLKMQDRQAEADYARAFVALQAEMPNVKAMRPVPDKHGGIKYCFAPYEDIMEQLAPKLQTHGFTVSFSTDFAEGRMVKLCRLTHISGHSRETKFAVRVGQGPPGCNEAQADGAASTLAKRYALCEAVNIVIDHDKDANAEGDAITPEQAESLRQRVHDTGSDEKRFLKFAGAASYEEIASGRYAELDSLLRKREPPR